MSWRFNTIILLAERPRDAGIRRARVAGRASSTYWESVRGR
jgi:hypothetical protein